MSALLSGTSCTIFCFNTHDLKFLVNFQFFKGAFSIAPHGFHLHGESLLILYSISQGLYLKGINL